MAFLGIRTANRDTDLFSSAFLQRAPTADDIANAVRKKLSDTHDANSRSLTPLSPPTIAQNKKPQLSGKHPKKAMPTTPTPTKTAPPLHAHLSITQSPKISTRTDAPVETEVVVQTDIVFPTLKFVMQCDKPLIDAQPTIGGTNSLGQMSVSSGIIRDHPNVVVYSYGSSAPPFGPANPLVIDVWSEEPVTCDQVATI